jgi:HrpA-like RNA helicase
MSRYSYHDYNNRFVGEQPRFYYNANNYLQPLDGNSINLSFVRRHSFRNYHGAKPKPKPKPKPRPFHHYRVKKNEMKEECEIEKKHPLSWMTELKIYPLLEGIMQEIKTKQVIQLAAETGTGKSVSILASFIHKVMCNDDFFSKYKLLVSEPTVVNVIYLHQYLTKMMPEAAPLIGRGCSGVKSENFHSSKASYLTTQTLVNYLINLWTATEKRELLNNLIIMIDEAHHSSVENKVLHALCNWFIKKGLKLKVIVSTATPCSHSFENLKVKPIELKGTQHPIETIFHNEAVVKYSNKITDIDNDNLLSNLLLIFNNVIKSENYSGDILIFLPGENEVNDFVEILEIQLAEEIKEGKYSVYSLYSNLPEESLKSVQENVPETQRKIIVATNVAESGVTFQNVRIVIDPLLHKKVSVNIKGSRVINLEAISKASSTQRKGRAGRCQPGWYFPMTTKDEWDNLQDYYTSDFDVLPKEMVVLSLLSKGLPAGEILMIEQEEYDDLLSSMRKMNLIDEENKVTPIGLKIIEFSNVSLYTAILLAHSKEQLKVSFDDFKEKNQNFYELLHMLIAAVVIEVRTNSPHVFFVPKEERKNKINYIKGGIYDDFVANDDVTVLVRIFVCLMIEQLDTKNADKKKKLFWKQWTRNKKIVTKFIETSYQLFNQLLYRVFDFGKVSDMMLLSDFENLYVNDYSEMMYKFFASVYHNRKYVLKPYSLKTTYRSMNDDGTRFKDFSVDNASVSTMWTNAPKYILALSDTTISCPGKRSFTILNLCVPLTIIEAPAETKSFSGLSSDSNSDDDNEREISNSDDHNEREKIELPSTSKTNNDDDVEEGELLSNNNSRNDNGVNERTTVLFDSVVRSLAPLFAER